MLKSSKAGLIYRIHSVNLCLCPKKGSRNSSNDIIRVYYMCGYRYTIYIAMYIGTLCLKIYIYI